MTELLICCMISIFSLSFFFQNLDWARKGSKISVVARRPNSSSCVRVRVHAPIRGSCVRFSVSAVFGVRSWLDFTGIYLAVASCTSAGGNHFQDGRVVGLLPFIIPGSSATSSRILLSPGGVP